MNEKIHLLHEIGFRVSMDDFGSGYSSLNILGKLKIDELKLDKGFLQEIFEKIT
ncbi:EAL domain-containing protein [Allocoprobacillus halotolerans]|uniref:EAL domain-containing protein n=1 Tax=Allocoprobacillus halotolerans TaxID=2944914 RepID=A0ABY5I389_9FIRM|nr:EAL domain-containing protein [Allocoprobacillus halotolerans]UTY39829.1 EAL domain-containing protein [Allocoprobacillus halotolerans]